MKLCALMTPSMSNTDYSTIPRFQGRDSKAYEGAYSFFISNQLVPVACHEPVWLDETTEDRYGEKRGKGNWVIPTLGAYQRMKKGKMEWLFPIFTSIEDIEESPIGKWLMRKFKNRWSVQNHWNPEKAKTYRNQLWLRDVWSDQIKMKRNAGYDAFTICISIKAYGPHYIDAQAHMEDVKTYERTDMVGETLSRAGNYLNRPPQGWDFVGEGDQRRIVPSARKEVGKFFRTQYPMFVIPTAQTISGSYRREGGRYFNVAPMKQDKKNSPSLRFYAEECGFALERPVVVSKKPKMKPLTQAQETLAPKEWFMEQHMRYQNTIFKLPLKVLSYEGDERKWGSHNGVLVKHLIAGSGGHAWAYAEIGRANAQNGEILSTMMSSYIFPTKHISDDSWFSEMYEPPQGFLQANFSWPLTPKQLHLLKKKNSSEGAEDVEFLEYTYDTISLPPHMDFISQKGIEYGNDMWAERDMGLMNYGFLDFITPTVWDD